MEIRLSELMIIEMSEKVLLIYPLLIDKPKRRRLFRFFDLKVCRFLSCRWSPGQRRYLLEDSQQPQQWKTSKTTSHSMER